MCMGTFCPGNRFSARRAVKGRICNTCCHGIVIKFVPTTREKIRSERKSQLFVAPAPAAAWLDQNDSVRSFQNMRLFAFRCDCQRVHILSACCIKTFIDFSFSLSGLSLVYCIGLPPCLCYIVAVCQLLCKRIYEMNKNENDRGSLYHHQWVSPV